METLLSGCPSPRPRTHTHVRVRPHVTLNSGTELGSAFLDKTPLTPGSSYHSLAYIKMYLPTAHLL